MIGFGFSVFTQAILGAGGFAKGSSLALDFTSGNRRLDPRIIFSRTTNATVTGSTGLIQNAPMNLLTFSEQFDNAAWTSAGTLVVAANDTAAPNGTVTADKFTITALSAGGEGGRAQTFTCVATTYSVSWYVKQGTITGARIGLFDGTNFATRDFTFSSKTFGNPRGTLPVVSTSYTELADGWYRLQATITSGAASASASVGVNATSTGTGWFWGAQLEAGSTATTYNPTTVKNLLGYTEHFDNAAWTKSNAFVQTNLLTYSQDFDNAAWTRNQLVAVTANQIAAPDGTQTADLLIPNTTGGVAHSSYQSVTVAAAVYTLSIYAKAGGYSGIKVANLFTGVGASFNLATGVVFSADAGVTAAITGLADGWYRCQITFTATAGSTLYGAYIQSPVGTSVFAGDGTSGIYVWGAQLVQGTSAGDYKATYAAAAAVGYTDIYGQPFAQKLVEDTAASGHSVDQSVTMTAGTSYTASVFAKQGERRYMFLRFFAGGAFPTNYIAIFDLQEGTAINSSTLPVTAFAITSVGNGWYRCSITQAATSTGSGQFRALLSADGVSSSYTGNGTSGIYIFGAQLSDSASVDPYVYNPVAAPTSTAYYGPRFDYDPVTLAPKGLLIEEQRTNLLTYSEQFDNAAWLKSNATVTANSVVAPDGTLSADTLSYTASGSLNRAIQSAAVSVSSGQTVTKSIYLKTNGQRFVQIPFLLSGNQYANFDLVNGTVTQTSASCSAAITSVGNGWYRCTATASYTSSGNDYGYVWALDGGASVFASSSNSGSSVYVWGAQLEAGAFATSYIPTVASQVTRAADSASMIGNNFARWFNVNEGTLYASASSYIQGLSYVTMVAAISNSAALTSAVRLERVTGDAARVVISQDGADVSSTLSWPAGTTQNIAAAYKSSGAAAALSGSLLTLTSVKVPVNPLFLYIGSTGGVGNFFNGTIKRISYYPRRLANTELQGITA